MMALIEKYGVEVMNASDETDSLADEYLATGALPNSSRTDAHHIAAAAVGDMDIIVSLNFRHIVKGDFQKPNRRS